MLRNDTCELPHTNLYLYHQSYEIVFCYVSQIFAYFILPHVVLYFIFSRRFLVIIVSRRAHKDAHRICLNFVSCHVHYYSFYLEGPGQGGQPT